ncbi:hypothetical protein Pint_08382 [Pistacia integerrima]|uniref:Uncharacterized protein n=1 Tax=Pistacia integerrima TaxID=434235 RepID=A0ACC0XYI5_9ROSI|nr:hypothetical protein Pint_08382 [Pistacia integerrima]
MQRRRRRVVVVLRKLITCAICVIALVALLSVHIHVFPSSKVSDFSDPYKLPTVTQHTEQSWTQELAPPHMSKAPLPSRKVSILIFCFIDSLLRLDSWMVLVGVRILASCGSLRRIAITCLVQSLVLIIHLLHRLVVFFWFIQMVDSTRCVLGFVFLFLSMRESYFLFNIPGTRKFFILDDMVGCKLVPSCGENPLLKVCPQFAYSSSLSNMLRWSVEVFSLYMRRDMICDMVAVARIINATLVVPELDKRSFWQDSSNFSDVFDEYHFINALANDVKVIKKLPKEFTTATRAVKHFRSWSGMDYYRDEIASLWEDYQVIRAAKSDSRLANNNLPPDIQKLRCRACYEALRFAPRIEAMGKLLVDRMRSYGRYISLHLRYEKDMLAFSGCTHDLSPVEADELRTIRENTAYWKVKDIDSEEQRSKGYCPLTPKEVGIFLTALGYPSNTPIYIAAGEIYGGDSRMADLQSRYPIIMNKEKLASVEELEPFVNHASQMAALDYIVSVESDVFIPSYSGNMARAVEGHRRFLGHRKTISPDRKALVRLFDKIEKGTMKEGKSLANRTIEIHKRRYVISTFYESIDIL